MSLSDNKLYEFGSFRLDAKGRSLWNGEEFLALPPKVFDTLLNLIEAEGRVVTKADLMDAIWEDTFVDESNLSQNIYTLRRILGTDDDGGKFIETVPRRGYRFAAPIKLVVETAKINETDSTVAASEAANVQSIPYTLASRPNSKRADDATEVAEKQITDVSAGGRWLNGYLRFIGVAVLIAAAMSLAGYFLLSRTDGSEVTVSPIERLRFQRLTDGGNVTHPSISPNGELMAFVRQEDNAESVWVTQLATGSSIQTMPPSSKGYGSLTFSPNGSHLYFRERERSGAIYMVPTFGGSPKKIVEDVWSDFGVSPDGANLAYIRRRIKEDVYSLIVVNVDGSGERVVGESRHPTRYARVAPAWSPDSSKLAIVRGSKERPGPLVVMVDVGSGAETEFDTPYWRAITRVLWKPNDNDLIVAARAMDEPVSQLWLMNWQNGSVRRLTNDLESYFWISISADGQKLVSRQQTIVSQLWYLPKADISKAAQLTYGERNMDGFIGLTYTPDDRIVFSSRNGEYTDLYSITTDGSNRVQLTSNAGQDNTRPSTAKNGRHIVFTSNRTGPRQIWRMDLEGRNMEQLTFGESQLDSAYAASLAPDGTTVFFISVASRSSQIFKVGTGSQEPVPVSKFQNAAAEDFVSVSPDGKWLAYNHVSSQDNDGNVERRSYLGVISTDGASEPRLFEQQLARPVAHWSNDSLSICFIDGTFNSSSIKCLPIDGGEPKTILNLDERIFNFAWAANGEDLVVARGRMRGDAVLISNLP